MATSDRYDFRFRTSISFPLATEAPGLHCSRVAHEGWGAGMILVRQHTGFYPLFIVVAGRGTYATETHSHCLARGDAFTFGSALTTITCDRHSPLEVRVMALTGQNGPRLLAEALTRNDTPIHLNDPTEPLMLLTQLLDEAKRSLPYREEACSHLAHLVLVAIRRSMASDRHVAPPASYLKFRSAIANAACKAIELMSLARQCGLSPEHATRLFKLHAGESPTAYRTRLRMTQVCEMLTNPDLTLDTIATTVGYSDGFALSRAFTRVIGVAPLHWRQQYRY